MLVCTIVGWKDKKKCTHKTNNNKQFNRINIYYHSQCTKNPLYIFNSCSFFPPLSKMWLQNTTSSFPRFIATQCINTYLFHTFLPYPYLLLQHHPMFEVCDIFIYTEEKKKKKKVSCLFGFDHFEEKKKNNN